MMPKHLAFVCAMPMELAPLTKKLSLGGRASAPSTFTSGPSPDGLWRPS